MGRYIVKRLLLLIPVIFGVMFIVFTIMAMTPGTPAKMILGAQATPEEVAQLNEELGFNRPFLVRFVNYVVDALRGDFGESCNTQRPVFEEIIPRLPTTVTLAFLSVISSALVGIPIGIVSAVKQYSFIDGFTTTVALLLAGIPGFWLGMMLILLFAVQLGWLPANGIGTWKHYVLPTLTLCLTGSSVLIRVTRTMMLETIRQDYIRTARAKGVPGFKVIFGHALKNSLIPVITYFGPMLAYIVTGSIVVEQIFAVPGIGRAFVNSITGRDYPLIMGTTIILACLIIIMNLVSDLLYKIVDPADRTGLRRREHG